MFRNYALLYVMYTGGGQLGHAEKVGKGSWQSWNSLKIFQIGMENIGSGEQIIWEKFISW